MINTLKYLYQHPIGTKNKINTTFRFLQWQLKARLSPKNHVVPFIMGTKLSVKKGMTGATGNIYTGLHEFEDMSFLLHFLRETDVFADIGSNIGSYSILASGVCKAKTFAFEPIPSTFGHLQENIKVNNLSHLVSAHLLGVGSEKGSLYFTGDHDTMNHVVINPKDEENAVKVDIVSLDSFLSKVPNLIKIDVEGFEIEVLKGSQSILSSPDLKAIIIELNGSGKKFGYNDNDIHEMLIGQGFKTYDYHPFERKLVEKIGFGTEGNTIYCRDYKHIVKRIDKSKLIKFLNYKY